MVVKDIPDNVTAFGCPCRVMKHDKDMKINKVNITGGGDFDACTRNVA